MGTADFTHAIEVNGPQDMRYLGQRLEWLRSRLHDLEEQQNRFLRQVSHELKTPLTAVREGAELLRDRVAGDLSPGQWDIVKIVRENTLQLQKLIEDLLTYHQTRAEGPQTVGPVFLPELVQRVIKEQKLAALARRITFDVKLAPTEIVADANRIRVIIDNLVSNAIKYSPRTGVITIVVAPQQDCAVLDVIDEGDGVLPAERARIFETFYQGNAPMGGSRQGLGTRPRDRPRIRARARRRHRRAGPRRSAPRRALSTLVAAFARNDRGRVPATERTPTTPASVTGGR
jgi:two-component system sensor histidine kinase GlrK